MAQVSILVSRYRYLDQVSDWYQSKNTQVSVYAILRGYRGRILTRYRYRTDTCVSTLLYVKIYQHWHKL